MTRSLLLAEVQRTPWALHPAALAGMSAMLQRWAAGLAPSEAVMAAIAQDKAARAAKQTAAIKAGGSAIAVLPLYGVVTQRGSMADDISGPGSCSTQKFATALRDALADDAVGQVLIDIDSPGGSVYGVVELANEIAAARGNKPIIGVANSMAASAAYWIGAQCSELYCTPGGEVGSIGVYTAHADMSAALAGDGVAMTLISAGPYKTEGNPYEPLSEEAKAAIQQSVDGYYSLFTKAVARGRGVPIDAVRQGMGQGRCLSAADALDQKMVDGIASFDDVVAMLQKRGKAQARPAASRLALSRRRMAML
jgi:signal peptide peptidase SppA